MSGCIAKGQESCPASILVTSAVRSNHDGWESFGPEEAEDRPHPLRAAAFTDGHPRDRAYLRPSSSAENKAAGSRTDVYEFSSVSEEGVWLVCQYRDTRQSLFHRIRATRCEVTATEQPGKPVESIVCR
jgi:hypothetical protein